MPFLKLSLHQALYYKSENARGVFDLSSGEVCTPVWAISVLEPGVI